MFVQEEGELEIRCTLYFYSSCSLVAELKFSSTTSGWTIRGCAWKFVLFPHRSGSNMSQGPEHMWHRLRDFLIPKMGFWYLSEDAFSIYAHMHCSSFLKSKCFKEAWRQLRIHPLILCCDSVSQAANVIVANQVGGRPCIFATPVNTGVLCFLFTMTNKISSNPGRHQIFHHI